MSLKITKLTFEEALLSDKNLLQFWLQGASYDGAWESLRCAIISHIAKINTANQTAEYNKVELHKQLAQLQNSVSNIEEKFNLIVH